MADQSSNYDALGAYLAGSDQDEITLTLVAIEDLIGLLPKEAHHSRFWGNIPDHPNIRQRPWLEKGFRAYFLQRGPSVRFVRDTVVAGDEDRFEKPWTEQELRTCVLAYRRLWDAERRGEKMNKSALRREALAGGMIGRVSGSYEFRMQNISALLDELGLPFVRGYLPRKNVGGLKARLISIINEIWQRTDTPEEATADPEALGTRVMAALAKRLSRPHSPPVGAADVKRTSQTSRRFVRDPDVIAWVLLRAEGRCEACGEPAPFLRGDRTPYLEVHHLRHLADGGPDVVSNAVATCPNCHRRLHHASDRQKYRREVLKRVTELIDHRKRSLTDEP